MCKRVIIEDRRSKTKDDDVSELAQRIRQAVKEAKAEGTVGMSRANLRQIVNTSGLRFANPNHFARAFEEALGQSGAKSFVRDCGGNVDASNLEHIATFIGHLVNGGWTADRIKDTVDALTKDVGGTSTVASIDAGTSSGGWYVVANRTIWGQEYDSKAAAEAAAKKIPGAVATRITVPSRDLASAKDAVKEGDKVWAMGIGGYGGKIKGEVEGVYNGQVHVIENGTGKRFIFHPANVHLSSGDSVKDTVIKAGKRTVIIHQRTKDAEVEYKPHTTSYRAWEKNGDPQCPTCGSKNDWQRTGSATTSSYKCLNCGARASQNSSR